MAGIAFERDAQSQKVIEDLKRCYKTKVLPLEQTYRFDMFHQPFMSDAEFDSRPQVMLIGQYSVGKTSFIRYILGRDFPGQRIGPEPTTDRFVAVMDGVDERVIPGNALAVSNNLPFKGLERFGVAFLNRFEGSQLPSQILKNITLIDTPGVLSGEKQRVARGYDFNEVCGWFAQRCDLILLLFDAHKLDISDEFKGVIESLKGNDDKIRCILNKADQVDRQKLMRVYGALMWSLGKVMKTPEVLRVYIGTFWDQPLRYDDNAELFELEKADLLKDLKYLPRNSAMRKINELVKRVRTGKVHAYIISALKEQMPSFMGFQKKQTQLIEDLPKVFRSCMKRYNLAPGDFPDIENFRSKLVELDFTKFSSLKQRLLDDVDTVLGQDLPRFMDQLPRPPPSAAPVEENAILRFDDPPMANAFLLKKQPSAPVENPWGEDDGTESASWDLQEYVPQYQSQFDSIQKNGLISGAAAKPILSSSGLQTAILKRIWALSDIDRDGSLDLEEFVVARVLIEQVKAGAELPESLDEGMIPPAKRLMNI